MLRSYVITAIALAAGIAAAQGPRNHGKSGMMGGMGHPMEMAGGMPSPCMRLLLRLSLSRE